MSDAGDERASDDEDEEDYDNETSARGEGGDARGHGKSAARSNRGGAVDACAGLDSWFEAALALFARPTNALLGGVYDRHTLALAGKTKEPELVSERERDHYKERDSI